MAITETVCNESVVFKTAKVSTDLDPELHQRKFNDHQAKVNGLQREITYALFETDTEVLEDEVEVIEKKKNSKVTNVALVNGVSTKKTLKPKQKFEYVWFNILGMVGLHLGAALGYLLAPRAHTATILWTYLMLLLGTLGVQAGAHRLWCHKAYKANFGVRLFLSLCHVLALQNDIYEWSRDHRAHHKFADTDADPHDSSKGFVFSHVGWLLVKKHPEVKRRGATLDLSDLLADPIVVFQKKYYIPMVAIFWGAIPCFVPVLCWGEDLIVSGSLCVMARYVTSLNLTWLVNSWSHFYGNKPYDQKLAAVEASIRHVLMGEGFHNYHHAFPWDYSASELGPADVFNPATAAIDFFHYMGWAWDLKKVKPDMIDSKMRKSGDPAFYHKHNTPLYEWTTGFITLSIPLVAMFGAKIIFGNVDENSTSLFMQILNYTNFAKFLK